jgi:broad specificity phosphatase PhoE
MGMPRDLVLVRHGQSEANVIQKHVKEEDGYEIPEGFLDRHDSEMLLTTLGTEQAQAAGKWLRREFPEGFDHYYVSSLARTIQTAGNLALGGDWVVDDRLRERDWGEFNSVNKVDQKRLYGQSLKLRQQNKWYWCPPGGENLATGVRLRWERMLGTMHREMDGQTFIGVTHGETIEVGRVILERLLIPEWLEQEKDPDYKLANCQILHYTRIDPETGQDAGHLLWRRSVCPWDESKSWQGGAWQHFDIDRRFSDDQLLAMAALNPPLLEN